MLHSNLFGDRDRVPTTDMRHLLNHYREKIESHITGKPIRTQTKASSSWIVHQRPRSFYQHCWQLQNGGIALAPRTCDVSVRLEERMGCNSISSRRNSTWKLQIE
ncbi:hypothetical protein scyTo_0013658 [Scyliorhinus torazame]|uniref:Uncharacterized protein n=1 Tax=Scyliorhinus torazame TaxID=75743 RepID=A0A401P214_SCYTO|nr:hypothetical protein [Scyliorhinus torazame]